MPMPISLFDFQGEMSLSQLLFQLSFLCVLRLQALYEDVILTDVLCKELTFLRNFHIIQKKKT